MLCSAVIFDRNNQGIYWSYPICSKPVGLASLPREPGCIRVGPGRAQRYGGAVLASRRQPHPATSCHIPEPTAACAHLHCRRRRCWLRVCSRHARRRVSEHAWRGAAGAAESRLALPAGAGMGGARGARLLPYDLVAATVAAAAVGHAAAAAQAYAVGRRGCAFQRAERHPRVPALTRARARVHMRSLQSAI